MVWVLIALAIVSNILYPGFFDWGNIKNILFQNAPVGMVAVGMTFVIIAGGFDLSVGALFAGGAVLYAKFSNSMPLPLAFVASVGAGMGAGAINGAIIMKLKVNAFVATLGSASLFGGAVYMFSNSAPIIAEKSNFQSFGTNDFAGLPIVVWALAGAVVVGGVVLARSVYGRSIYSVGGNEEAARLAGIRIDLVRASTYVLTGGCAALAGMMFASRTGVGQADVGVNITLDAIAIVIIGGTSLLGGEGAMWRTVVGLLMLGTINNLFDSLGWQSPAQQVVKGSIVIAAVSIDSLSRRRFG
jgi:ribose transport system permease protein